MRVFLFLKITQINNVILVFHFYTSVIAIFNSSNFYCYYNYYIFLIEDFFSLFKDRNSNRMELQKVKTALFRRLFVSEYNYLFIRWVFVQSYFYGLASRTNQVNQKNISWFCKYSLFLITFWIRMFNIIWEKIRLES